MANFKSANKIIIIGFCSIKRTIFFLMIQKESCALKVLLMLPCHIGKFWILLSFSVYTTKIGDRYMKKDMFCITTYNKHSVMNSF